jgi:DNA-binding NarL/FixJ family response regulator
MAPNAPKMTQIKRHVKSLRTGCITGLILSAVLDDVTFRRVSLRQRLQLAYELRLRQHDRNADTPSKAVVRVLWLDRHPAEAADPRAKLADSRRVSFSVRTATSVAESAQLLERERFEAVIVDTNTPKDQGLATLAEIRSLAPDVPAIAVACDYDESEALEMVRAGAQDYVVKNRLNSAAIERILLYCMERQRGIRRGREIIQKAAAHRAWAASNSGPSGKSAKFFR